VSNKSELLQTQIVTYHLGRGGGGGGALNSVKRPTARFSWQGIRTQG
jgi:hypothetical protein